MPTHQPPTVFIVDSDPASAQASDAVAQALGLTTRSFAAGKDFLAGFDPSRPGCLVMEAQLPDMSGIELRQALTERGSELPAIILTSQADVPLAVRALRSGALTLLEKPCNERDLTAAIREALAKNEELRRQSARQHEAQRRLGLLTPKERQVLNEILAGRATKEIARSLDISVRTVEIRRRAIFQKVQTQQLAELVRIVIDAGEMTS